MFALLLGAAAPARLSADDEQAAGPTPAELVAKLAHPEYLIREEASRRLGQLGMEAREALQAGSRSPDREVRYRCLRILRTVEQADFRRRLVAFAERREIDRPLPGWNQFSKAYGDSPSTRQLFVEMQRNQPELMAALERDELVISSVLNQRAAKLDAANRSFRYQVTTGDIAALLFAAGDEEVDVSTQATSAINRFCLSHGFDSASALGANRDVMRQLLGRWIRRGDGWAAYRAMELARRFGLKDGLTPAKNIIRSNDQQTNAKQHAILTVAKLGDRSDISLLKTLLDDPTVCSTQRFNRDGKSQKLQGQLRDVALAAVLHIYGQNPLDFGFDRQLTKHPDMVFQINSIGFVDQEDRDEAFKKWEAWAKKNLPEPPKSP